MLERGAAQGSKPAPAGRTVESNLAYAVRTPSVGAGSGAGAGAGSFGNASPAQPAKSPLRSAVPCNAVDAGLSPTPSEFQ